MDPLVALVLFALVGAAGMVVLLQIDDDANAVVDVDLATFVAGDLPAICCKTGAPAAIGVSVLQRRWFRTVVEGIVPITQPQHERFSVWRDLNRWSTMSFVPLALIGLAVRAAADTTLVDWIIDSLLLIVLFVSVFTNLAARRTLAVPRKGSGPVVTLRAVHPDFVKAVRASRQPSG